MCGVCASDRSEIARNYWGAQFAPASIHFQTATLAEAADGVLEFTRWDDAYALASTELVGSDKLSDAFPIDGVGDPKPIMTNAGLIVTVDAIPDDKPSTQHIAVDSGTLISTQTISSEQKHSTSDPTPPTL